MPVVKTGTWAGSGASILNKLVFWSLLASLGVALNIVYVNYQARQLKTAYYTKYVPPSSPEVL